METEKQKQARLVPHELGYIPAHGVGNPEFGPGAQALHLEMSSIGTLGLDTKGEAGLMNHSPCFSLDVL